ncbi:MAG: hypothetical protein GEU78_12180 [Actinobacteria bacterium]|nr:hypothetical protein [Actinomycetota bacterium]
MSQRERHVASRATISGFLVAALAAPISSATASPPLAPPTPTQRVATPVLIDEARRGGQISRFRADLYLAYALAAPGRLPAAYRSEAPWRGTLPLLRLRERIAKMREGPRRARLKSVIEASSAPTRCDLNNSPANRTTSDHYVVDHPSSIGGGLTIDDYVASLEAAWAKQTTGFGWAAPPLHPDAGSKYHVIVANLSPGLYGFVSPSGTFAGDVGDNPNTPWAEPDAYATCMALNDNYSGFPSLPQDSLDSTTAHEFNHSIQFGYGALSGPNRPDNAFIEGGATWMEDEVFDGADDNYNYLWPDFHRDMGAYDASPYPYWITFRGMTERYGTGVAGGGEQVMQDFWEDVSKETHLGLDAMNHALTNRGTSLAAAYHAYAIAVKFSKTCGGSYVLPYCFEEGGGYVAEAGLPPIAGNGGTIAAVGGSFSGSVRDNYALNWVRLPSASTYGVTLSNTSDAGEMRATIACDTGSALKLTPMPAVVGPAGSTTLSWFAATGCSSVIAVITNEAQTGADPSSSAERAYKIQTTAPGDTTPPSAPSLASLRPFLTTTEVRLRWSPSSDPQSGVAFYRIQRRTAPPNRALGAWQGAGTSNTTSRTIGGLPGYTYCFRVAAVNGAGLRSAFSTARCTALPRNDRSLSASDGWARRSGSGHYLGTFSRTSRFGATLRKHLTAKRLALVATRCPGCGTVKVFLGRRLLKKVSLGATATRKKRVIRIATFSSRRSGRVRIRVVSRKKPVLIEGLGAGAI